MSHDDLASEPIRGLPELPPEGERILWQGRPDAWTLIREALSFWWIAGYFALLALWRFVSVVDLMPLPQAFAAALPFAGLAAVTLGILAGVGWVQARCTVYTVTNRRVAMRIGAALTLTLNIPYSQVEGIDFARRKDGAGTLAFRTLGPVKLSYLVCWPHVRPWKIARTQPALRCIKDADEVARIVATAAEQRVTQPRIERRQMPSAVAAE